MVASVPIDMQVHDTYFVVAHLHYVLIGGAIFPLLGAILYWYPKVTGRMTSDRLGKLSFWLTFIGFNVTFFPMHILGLHGMPRRDYTYFASMNWGNLNMLATIGAGILGIGVLLYVINALVSLRTGEVAGANPWGGYGLEWATSSPPPPYNFAELPTVRDRYALWTSTPDQPVVVGLRTDRMETLVTRLLDAEPDHVVHLPHATPVPFLVTLASAIGIITAIFTPWGVPLGMVLVVPALIAWFWPHPPHQTLLEEQP
jgi:cytochrome c oxidase subunit 1